MTDKILKEAFDKLTRLEESADLSVDELQDGIEAFTELREELLEFRERLDNTIRMYAPSESSYWRSYGLGQLAIIAGSEEYASHDRNIGSLIEKLNDELEGDDDFAEERSPRMR